MQQRTISLQGVEIRKDDITSPVVQHPVYEETNFSSIISDSSVKFPCNVLVLCQLLCRDFVILRIILNSDNSDPI